MPIPKVTIYIRRHTTRRYEKLRNRNPQSCHAGDVYCLHVWNNGKNKWVTVSPDLRQTVSVKPSASSQRSKLVRALTSTTSIWPAWGTTPCSQE